MKNSLRYAKVPSVSRSDNTHSNSTPSRDYKEKLTRTQGATPKLSMPTKSSSPQEKTLSSKSQEKTTSSKILDRKLPSKTSTTFTSKQNSKAPIPVMKKSATLNERTNEKTEKPVEKTPEKRPIITRKWVTTPNKRTEEKPKVEEKSKTVKKVKTTKEKSGKSEETPSFKGRILKAFGIDLSERAPKSQDDMEKKHHDSADPDNVHNI